MYYSLCFFLEGFEAAGGVFFDLSFSFSALSRFFMAPKKLAVVIFVAAGFSTANLPPIFFNNVVQFSILLMNFLIILESSKKLFRKNRYVFSHQFFHFKNLKIRNTENFQINKEKLTLSGGARFLRWGHFFAHFISPTSTPSVIYNVVVRRLTWWNFPWNLLPRLLPHLPHPPLPRPHLQRRV